MSNKQSILLVYRRSVWSVWSPNVIDTNYGVLGKSLNTEAEVSYHELTRILISTIQGPCLFPSV